MVRFKTFMRSNILERFTNNLTKNGVEDIEVRDMDERGKNHFSPATHDAVQVTFTAKDSMGGRILKSIIAGAKRGEFGNNRIVLIPTQSIHST